MKRSDISSSKTMQEYLCDGGGHAHEKTERKVVCSSI